MDGSYKYNKSEGHFISSSFPSVLDTRISTYQISPRLLSDLEIFDLSSESIIGLDLNYAYYSQDKMQGQEWYKNIKHQDLNIGPYFNSNIKITDLDSISVGFRYQWNWLRAGDMKDDSSITSAFNMVNKKQL